MIATMGYAAYNTTDEPKPFNFERRELKPTDVQLEILYCGVCHSVSDVEVIEMAYINKAYERMLKGDVKYRFVIDMATL